MIVSHSWLPEHYNDADLVILDSRGNVAYSYAHIPRRNIRLYDGSMAYWIGQRLPLG
ncbi:MAG: hypothetical protein ACREBI_00985 [Nitrosotalea sp.]